MVICDNCGEVFNHIKEDQLANYSRLYLKCGECGKEYDVMFKCDRMIELIAERQRLSNGLTHTANVEGKSAIDVDKYFEGVNKELKLIKEEIDRLNEANKNDYYQGGVKNE